MSMWEKNAHTIKDEYGSYVDWDERFYECPECGEPIYEDDWSNAELCILCPVCGFDGDNPI